MSASTLRLIGIFLLLLAIGSLVMALITRSRNLVPGGVVLLALGAAITARGRRMGDHLP